MCLRFPLIILISGLLAVHATVGFNAEVINESMRTMVGRDASTDEVEHFGNVIISGQQFAFFEPYTTPKNQTTEEFRCKWSGRSDPGSMEGITEFNAAEIDERGGRESVAINALLRTIAGISFPSDVVKHWTNESYASGGDLKTIAARMKESLGDGLLHWEAVDDIFMITLGRKANRDNCDLAVRPQIIEEYTSCGGVQPSNISEVSDCEILHRLGEGSFSVTDVIHTSRTLREYIEQNETLQCQIDFPDQYDFHAVGEYITKLHRLITGNLPAPEVLKQQVESHRGFDTRPLLKLIADQLLASVGGVGRMKSA